tara:strand:+ start:1686 stop:1832 length:147 start_codon:yes stop_codon:yes gene_type:complete
MVIEKEVLDSVYFMSRMFGLKVPHLKTIYTQPKKYESRNTGGYNRNKR